MEDEESLLQGVNNPDVQVEVEDEIQDWRNLSKVKDNALPKRGEKDYEPDGTDYQQQVLEDSRNSMYAALSGDRGHVIKQHVRAVWIPSVRRGLIEKPKGSFLQTCGVVDSQNKCWLRPEEFCYLAERGTIEPWFEGKDVAMSIQAVYACCFQDEDEIDEYHVYAYLKRHGFIVMRPDPSKGSEEQVIRSNVNIVQVGMIRRLYSQVLSILTNSKIFKLINKWTTRLGIQSYPSFHPLHFFTTKYTNYSQIYNSIKLIPFHSPATPSESSTPSTTTQPLEITFNIWKPSPQFRKTAPPPPNFQVLVRNTNKYSFPTLSQLRSLISRTNYLGKDAPLDENQQRRLKNGYGYVLMAIVDYGIVNFVKVSEAGFGDENVWHVPQAGKNNVKKSGKKFKQ